MVVSLAEAKDHLNLTSSANDAELSLFLATAHEVVTREAGAILPDVYTETVPVVNGRALLSHSPVTSVTSVNGVANTFALNPYGMLTGLPPLIRTVTVTYAAGNDQDVSATFDTATLMVLARLWETQRGNSPAILQGGEQSTFTPGMQGIVSEVRAILGSRSASSGIA